MLDFQDNFSVFYFFKYIHFKLFNITRNNEQISMIIRTLFLFHNDITTLGSNQLVKTSMMWKLVLEPEHRVIVG